jgi:hypothetical protein
MADAVTDCFFEWVTASGEHWRLTPTVAKWEPPASVTLESDQQDDFLGRPFKSVGRGRRIVFDVPGGYTVAQVPSVAEPETLTRLSKLGSDAADTPAMNALNRGESPAMAVRAGLHAALTQLAAQGFITVTDPSAWPEHFYPDGKPEGVG